MNTENYKKKHDEEKHTYIYMQETLMKSQRIGYVIKIFL